MGNNTSSTRKSTAGSRLSSGGVRRVLRKETDLDEEFSDLILHEVSKQQQQQDKQQKQQQQQEQELQMASETNLPEPDKGRSIGNKFAPSGFHSTGSWDKIKGTKQFKSENDNEEYEYEDDNNSGFDKKRRKSSAPYKQFLNDLIEDEYNELNDGLLETDAPELSRNILKNDGDDDTENDDDNDGILGDIEMEDAEKDRSSDEEHHVKSIIKPIKDDMDTDEEFSPTPDLSKVDFTKIVPGQKPPSQEHSSDELRNISSVPQLAEGQQQTTNQPVGQPATTDSMVTFQDNPSQPQLHHAHSTSMEHNRPPSYHSGTSTPTIKTLIPVEIKWVNSTKENIQKISIIGSFSNWRDVIRLKPSSNHQNEYVTKVNLPLGVHKLLYIINNEYRVSDQLPTATDQEGIFFNWFEVLDEAHLFNHSHNQQNHIGASTDFDANIIQQETQTAGRYEVDRIKKKSTSFLTKVTKTLEQPDFEHVEYQMEDQQPSASIVGHDTGTQTPPTQVASTTNHAHHDETPTYVSYQDEKSGSFFTEMAVTKLNYSSEIPEMFLNYDYFKNKGADYQLPEPPQLPAHLNNVLLNKMSSNQNQTHANNIPHIKRSGTSPVGVSNDPFKPPQPSFHEGSLSGNSHGNKRPPLRRADSSYYASNQEAYHLSIPNHVILNHLMTTSIRNDVLTVACITRYSGKFVTQIMHSPADT